MRDICAKRVGWPMLDVQPLRLDGVFSPPCKIEDSHGFSGGVELRKPGSSGVRDPFVRTFIIRAKGVSRLAFSGAAAFA
jgi:hypothetical protein